MPIKRKELFGLTSRFNAIITDLRAWCNGKFALLGHSHASYESAINNIQKIINLMTNLSSSPKVTVNSTTNAYGGLTVTNNDTTSSYDRKLIVYSKDAYCLGYLTIFIPRINFSAIDNAGGYYTTGIWSATCSARGCKTITIETTSATKISAKDKSISELKIDGVSGTYYFGTSGYTNWKKNTSYAGGDYNNHYCNVSGYMTSDGFYIKLECHSYGEQDDYATGSYTGPKSITAAYSN